MHSTIENLTYDGWQRQVPACRWRTILVPITVLAVVPVAWAQQVSPRIGYVYPAGGRQGQTFEVKVGGQYLNGVARADVSGDGVQVTVVEHTKPPTQKQINEMRQKLQKLQKMEEKDAAVREEIAEIRKKLAKFNRNANPAIAETVTLRVTMDPNAPPGARELRLATPTGLTNPLVFCVDQLPEFCETESSDDVPPRGSINPRFNRPLQRREPEPQMNVTLPAVVNGRIMPGDVDRYRFEARKGQQLVIVARARGLIPYLADAVPGWFQATLALYDAKGNELAYNDDYRFHPDPVLFYEVPEDGEYVIEIKDAIYRGREDFVYRIAIGELPFITSIFPLGGPAGARTAVEVRGRNLPKVRLTRDNKGQESGIHWLSVRRGQWVSNRVPFAVDTLPECREEESNDAQQDAQRVTLPVIVNGRIDKGGDRDVVCFEGRTGDEVVAEVYARRLGSPLDSVLKLTDATGRQLAFNDDHEDKGAGLDTHHADAWLCATVPANGTYYLHLGDAQHQGGEEYGYRLRISPPRADFELRVVPSSVTVRGGASVPLTVYALRKDGFSEEIALALKDPPAGFMLSGGWVPANQDQVRLTLAVPPKPVEEPVSVVLEGRAVVGGREICRPVVPADDMMQAFAYRHLVPARELKVTVSGRWMSKAPLRVLGTTPLKIPAGGTARVSIGAPGGASVSRARLELSEPPEGIAIQDVAAIRDGAELVLKADAAKVEPGLSGNLIVNVFARPPASGNAKPQVNRRRAPLGVLPAIPFEIVEP